MAFLEVNGVEVPTDFDSFTEEIHYIGDVARRGVTGRLVDNRVATKRRFRVQTQVQRWADAERLKNWIEGRGHSWSFDFSKYSDRTAVAPAVASSITVDPSGGKYGGKLSLGAGGSFGVQMVNKSFASSSAGWTPTDGWTLMHWRNMSGNADDSGMSGWWHLIGHGAVSVTRGTWTGDWSQRFNGSAGYIQMEKWTSVRTSASPYMGVTGHAQDGTASARDYDDLVLLPFEIDPAWGAGIYAFASERAWSPLPLVYVGGDCLNGGEPILMRGYVHDLKQLNARLPSAPGHEAQNRIMDVTFEEA